MRRFFLRVSLLLLLACPAAAFAASNSVVNLSHYDLMRVDFDLMRRQGIVGVIHESTYPPYVRDAYYARRQSAATRAGLLWGAYHFANASDPIRQADHFLATVRGAWERADPGGRPNEVLLVLDFEKNGHYPVIATTRSSRSAPTSGPGCRSSSRSSSRRARPRPWPARYPGAEK